MDILKRAKETQEELKVWCRSLHKQAEMGFVLGKTTALIKSELLKMGYTPKDYGRSEVVADV